MVAGIRTPEPIERLRDRMPEAFEQLVAILERLEDHYRDMQDIEFTIEDGKLSSCRPGLRNGQRRHP